MKRPIPPTGFVPVNTVQQSGNTRVNYVYLSGTKHDNDRYWLCGNCWWSDLLEKTVKSPDCHYHVQVPIIAQMQSDWSVVEEEGVTGFMRTAIKQNNRSVKLTDEQKQAVIDALDRITP